MAKPNFEVAGSRVLLTGATGGLGGAIAHALDDRGARLLLTGRRPDALQTLASELHEPEVLPCDFAQRDHSCSILVDSSREDDWSQRFTTAE